MTFRHCFPALLLASFLPLAPADDQPFPEPYNSEPDKTLPLSPEEAAKTMRVPEGFKTQVFAAEPDVQNPIAMAWDRGGRMWVAENYTYAEHSKRFDLNLRDRVIILEDKDGDGRAETRKVFTDKVQMLTSVELGHGGVWLMCPPQLLFIPDKNRDDVPDGPPEVMLDGFTVAKDNYHNFANGLRWGPDGWLYGRVGASCPGEVGMPGTPAEQRIPARGGIWRFHPQRKTFEMLCHGTTNPWGHDWDENGECFFINTVGGHLWHMIPGAHFSRPHTKDPNPYAYTAMEMIADHWHFDTGKDWTASRNGAADQFGGGHAHIGMMIYQGGQWPEQYRGKLFTLNMHGRRANVERLERQGSGYVGKHEPDVFFSADKWFVGMEITYGPDGSGYILDWSDTGECHDSTGVHRRSGRIFKLSYGEPKKADLSVLASESLSVEQWLELHRHPNEWFVRQARMKLAETETRARPTPRFIDPSAKRNNTVLGRLTTALEEIVQKEKETKLRLRALWSLNVMEQADAFWLSNLIGRGDEHLTVWAIRLIADTWKLDTIMSVADRNQLGEMNALSLYDNLHHLEGRAKKHSLIHLTLASTLQRIPPAERDRFIGILNFPVDEKDQNLDPMLWYGLLPLAESEPNKLITLLKNNLVPEIHRWIARRIASDYEKNPQLLNDLFQASPAKPSPILEGINDAFRGQRQVKKPENWDAFVASIPKPNEATQTLIRQLSLLFGDGRALDEVKAVALDAKADTTIRESALKTLVENRPPDLKEICLKLLHERGLSRTAARGLALFDEASVGDTLAKTWSKFHESDRPAVAGALVTRPAFAAALLSEMAAGRIPRDAISASHARQLRAFNDDALTKKLGEVWGDLRDSADDKKALMAQIKKELTPDALKTADLPAGRLLFQGICASCHKMYGEGLVLGPDLTGSGRANLDYLLENIVDPAAVVTADFRVNTVTMKDGRVLLGLLSGGEAEKTVALRMVGQELPLDRADIAKIEPGSASMMPDGLLQALSQEQRRDLLAYLMHPRQVPLK